MATDFYLTLPSNASMKMYPDNTLAHYITDLPQRIDLTGEWECGLADIQYPHTWYNVTEEDVWFFLGEKNPTGLTEYEVSLGVLQRSCDIDEPCKQGTGQYVDGQDTS